MVVFTGSYRPASTPTKKGRYLARRTTATTITSRLMNDRCAKRRMTAMTGSYRPASTPQKSVVTWPAEPRQRRSQVFLSVSGAINWNSKRALKMLNFEAYNKTENLSYLFLLQSSLLERPKVPSVKKSPTPYYKFCWRESPPRQTGPICPSS